MADKISLMICEYANHCTFECPLKLPHELNQHPRHYGDCNSGCEGDAPGTLAGAKCKPTCVVCNSKPQSWSNDFIKHGHKAGICTDCWQSW